MLNDAALNERLLIEYQNNTSTVIDIHEFREDVKRIMYVSRILRRYKNSGYINARLLLNHLVILFNVFGGFVVGVLEAYVDNDIHPELYGAMHYLSRLEPSKIQYADSQIQQIIERDISNG